MINYLRLKLFSNIVLTAILLSVCFSLAAAKDGDTIKVRTVEFGASRDGWFTFPSAGTGFEKVLMNYKLKCPKGSPCGEWDYIAYVFVKQFFKFDTTYPTPANPVITKTRVYYSDSTTVTESTEIMRYITPYGNGLNLGSGYVWVIDVTDFLPFLSDSVYISAPNGQEDLELTFDFILGTPPRNIINFRNMWNKNLTYDSTFEENVAPMDIQFDDNEKMARLKIVQTGHGFGGTVDNCAEFCKKESYILVNKDTLYKKFVWRECGDNFLYPQGGTWLLDRTNWCPGAEVTPYDYELSKYIQPGKTASIDYGMEYYNEKWTSGSNTRPNWVLRSYLITYSDPNFELDASIEDIISPSLKQEYLRLNPICNGAEIIIKNNGNRKLTSLDFEYGIVGGGKAAYHWTGNLDFIQTEKVKLPPFDWGKWQGGNTFYVKISNPNGGTDEYSANDYAQSKFESTPMYYHDVILELKTTNYNDLQASSPYREELYNENHELVFSKEFTENSTQYSDTLNLESGCYKFYLFNDYGYGLSYWALEPPYGPLNKGYFRIISGGKSQTSFKMDFGNTIYHQFRVGDKPSIAVSKDTIVFGGVLLGNDTTISLFITPKNNAGLTLLGLNIPLGTNKGLTIESINPSLPTEGLELNYEDSAEVKINFKPVKAGNISASISISSNDDINPVLNLKISGTGIDPNLVIENDDEAFPIELSISQNPISNTGSVKVYQPFSSGLPVNLSLYNNLGQKLSKIFEGFQASDYSEYLFDVNAFPDGIYYIVLKLGNESMTQPVIITK